MNAVLNSDQTGVKSALETLMAEHGVWPTLRAALGLALLRRDRVLQPQDLTPHLRRDLGLQEPEPGRKYWELR